MEKTEGLILEPLGLFLWFQFMEPLVPEKGVLAPTEGSCRGMVLLAIANFRSRC